MAATTITPATSSSAASAVAKPPSGTAAHKAQKKVAATKGYATTTGSASTTAASKSPIAATPKPVIAVASKQPIFCAGPKDYAPHIACPVPFAYAGRKPPTPAFAVFMHRSELNRKRLHFFKVSQTKIHLTDHLIHKTRVRNGRCSWQDHQFMVREMGFRNFLHHQLVHRHMQMNAAMKMKKAPKLKRLQ